MDARACDIIMSIVGDSVLKLANRDTESVPTSSPERAGAHLTQSTFCKTCYMTCDCIGVKPTVGKIVLQTCVCP